MESMSGMSNSASSTMSNKTMSMTASLSSAATAAATTMATASTEGSRGMGMDMGGDDCKISMVWNWHTVDACFVSHTWRIKSAGMFAGLCIGIIGLVLLLEFLRRAGKEYDAHILKAHRQKLAAASSLMSSPGSSTDAGDVGKQETYMTKSFAHDTNSTNLFRPSLLQQLIRASFHTMAFAVGYFLMLLAMYYNGYIILCIFIGAFLGFFIFGWEPMAVGPVFSGPAEESTNCCG